MYSVTNLTRRVFLLILYFILILVYYGPEENDRDLRIDNDGCEFGEPCFFHHSYSTACIQSMHIHCKLNSAAYKNVNILLSICMKDRRRLVMTRYKVLSTDAQRRTNFSGHSLLGRSSILILLWLFGHLRFFSFARLLFNVNVFTL